VRKRGGEGQRLNVLSFCKWQITKLHCLNVSLSFSAFDYATPKSALLDTEESGRGDFFDLQERKDGLFFWETLDKARFEIGHFTPLFLNGPPKNVLFKLQK
jgi:hypothetical protein